MSRTINIIDPQQFTSTHSCEFRLNKSNVAYLTNGAYLCLGAHATNGTRGEVLYNRRAGIASLIKNIRLLNGGDVLAQLDNAGTWMAWKGLNQDNANAISRKQMSFNTAGIELDGLRTTSDERVKYQQIIVDSEAGVTVGTLGTSEATASVGSMELKSFLKELEVLTVLPTAIFSNLRLEIRWNTDVNQICKKMESIAGVVSSVEAVRPLLVIESIEDPMVIAQMIQSMGQLNFTCIESDRFVIPDISGANTRTTHNFTIRGFNDKIINRVLVVNSPTGGADGEGGIRARSSDGDGTVTTRALDSGPFNSIAQNRYTLQCRVNGQALFTGRGLGYDDSIGGTGGAGYNHRLAVLGDTWGDVSICQAGNTVGLVVGGYGSTTDASGHFDYEVALAKQLQSLTFGSDYTGFKIMNRVSHLEFDISRTALAPNVNLPFMNSNDFNQSIHQIIFAEVPKVLQISGMNYRVSYL
tara:strand:+ start:204 stop:1610 length:1407 start_codon:yes stop_codon:yes gene_type:complete